MTSKFALVIANTEYQDAGFAKLTAPGKDAEEFAEVLRELASFDDVQVLLNEGEGKTRRSIARFFAERKRDDLLLLYFSGHGVRNDVGQLFLAANDTEINILEASGIPADFVTQSMNNSRSQRQLLILDCCNSGAFAYGSKSASAVGKSMGIASAFEGSGFGRVVLTATDATQYAWEGDKVIGDTQKSVFTYFLIEGLKGEADRDGDGRIHIDELYDYAYEQVVRRTPKQTPGKWSYKQQGDIILRENINPYDVVPMLLPPDLLELLSHPNAGVRRTGIQDLIGLLDGKHQGLSRAAQEKLREIAENDDSFSFRRAASEALAVRGLNVEQPEPIPFQVPKEKPKEEKPVAKPAPQRESTSPSERSRSTAERRQGKDEHAPKSKKVPLAVNYRIIGGIAGGVIMISLYLWGGTKPQNNQIAPTSALTNTAQPNSTNEISTSLALTTSTITPCAPPPDWVNTYVVKEGDTLFRIAFDYSVTTSEFQFANCMGDSAVLSVGQIVWVPNIPIKTSSSQPGIGSTLTGEDGMTLLYVSAGEFTMGSDNGDSDEKPVHKVNLDDFWIDQTEVTNKKYALCVSGGECELPRDVDRFGKSAYANHPVIYVSWNDAQAYCTWAGRRLPTEAEWEKAARGIDGRIYPWGNETPASGLLNYNQEIGETTGVGNYPSAASPYGALDMAGNVWEWVADWYGKTYYVSLPESNPLGPGSGQSRVLRGGGWYYGASSVRSANRGVDDPSYTGNDVGFRCAMSVSP